MNRTENRTEKRYPPIADYALISDCHCAALVSRDGSIDWCCMPRIDDESCFGRLLDWDKGGYCAVYPCTEYSSSRRYLPQTMILETQFRTSQGEIRLVDFFAMDEVAIEHASYDHVRVIEGVTGEVEVNIEISPRFDYGEIVPYIKRTSCGAYTATGSNRGLIIHSDIPLDVIHHRDLIGCMRIRAGERCRLLIQFQFPELIDKTFKGWPPGSKELDRYFERTRDWWQDWTRRIRAPHEPDEQTMRSTIVLKSLTFERTGAIAAAATTSLPEWPGGARNWDYRFSWIRDSVFTVRALHEPDHGIWEVRGTPRHYVHSKVMCWAALNRGIMLAQENGLEAPIGHWNETRDKVRHVIEQDGYDARRGIFVQAFGAGYLDAALLLLPRVSFVAYDDPRMLRTADAICEALEHQGLLRRYNSPDGLPGPEGQFLPCTFWLATCLACQGRLDRAWHYYRTASACANDIGLFSEEFDTSQQRMLGNFPQALTHVSQITARLALAETEAANGNETC